ncbi:hypothetical protein AB0L56_27620 [Streptomyces sp. NPDC052079]
MAAGGSYAAVGERRTQRIGSFDPDVPWSGQVYLRRGAPGTPGTL